MLNLPWKLLKSLPSCCISSQLLPHFSHFSPSPYSSNLTFWVVIWVTPRTLLHPDEGPAPVSLPWNVVHTSNKRLPPACTTGSPARFCSSLSGQTVSSLAIHHIHSWGTCRTRWNESDSFYYKAIQGIWKYRILLCITRTFLPKVFEGKIRMLIIHG